MTTEDLSPRTRDLDLWTTLEAAKALHEGQLAAVAAVGPALATIAAAVDDSVKRLRAGGRLIYVGAGTSGRLGVQDGAELIPTFNWPPEQLAFLMAGGDAALTRSIEGAEDSAADGAARMEELAAGANDVAVGIAASGATPFTIAAISAARRRGALTIGIANNPGAALLKAADHAILLDTGAEAIAGSTRMKAGTAQKVALNLFSTLAMVQLGRVYAGLMVDMRATNDKLRARSVRMVGEIAGVGEDAAAAALAKARDQVKVAALVARGLEADAAEALLLKHGGNLRRALAEIG
ncbi:MAG: N-acetylmuramic acid 6-phosphate etherase [Hyphomonadaceae bacterium]|nr:N-acetylmuramic acid 6-phosphate etherase [Hyphomonadaceae bacterium]